MRERRVRHNLGRWLVDGIELRSVAPIEGVWIGTFNLRWWLYVEREHETIPSLGDGRARQTRIESMV
jgi:hypothetical protein